MVGKWGQVITIPAIFLFSILFQPLRDKVQSNVDQVFYPERKSFKADAANIAHEIRNPLAAIKGMAQAVERDPGNTELMEDFRAVVPKEIDRLNRMAEKLLGISRLGKVEGERVNVNQIIENTLKIYSRNLTDNGIKTLREYGEDILIAADGEKLTQVFTNLITNAISAMPNGGTLTIQTEKKGRDQVITVADTGIGIEPDKIRYIFDPYFTTKEGGTGLGLTITRRIVEGLGWRIDVASEGGKGTSIKLMLQ